jgi:protein TonB
MVMTEESVDVAPRPRERHAPAYPPRARAKGITGVVTLSLLIGADGRVERVKVLNAEPSGVFEQTAISAVEQWYFEPAFYKGERVKVWARQVLRFNLS